MVIPELSEAEVAFRTEKSPYFSGAMAVVDVEVPISVCPGSCTDGTSSSLELEKLLVLNDRDPERCLEPASSLLLCVEFRLEAVVPAPSLLDSVPVAWSLDPLCVIGVTTIETEPIGPTSISTDLKASWTSGAST
jgi:hypothetical protein